MTTMTAEELGVALTVPQRAAVALGAAAHEKHLRELVAATTDIATITNKAGYDQCHSGRIALKQARIDLTAKAKEGREDAQAFAKAVIAEEKRLLAIITPEEERLDAIQRAYDAAREAEKQAKLEAERRRIALITSVIDTLRRTVADSTGMTSAQIAALRNTLAATREFEGWRDQFEEFANEAAAARDSAVIGLADLQDRVMKQEDEAAQIEADRKELAELKRLQAEKEEAAAKARAAEDARIKAEREAERKLLAEQQAAQEAEARAEREEAARLVAIEREKLRAELAEVKRREVAIADAEQRARDAEAARVKAEQERAEAEVIRLSEIEEAEQKAARARIVQEAERSACAADLAAASMADMTPREQADLERKAKIRPTDADIIEVLAEHYRVHELVIVEWLKGIDLVTVEAGLTEEFAS